MSNSIRHSTTKRKRTKAVRQQLLYILNNNNIVPKMRLFRSWAPLDHRFTITFNRDILNTNLYTELTRLSNSYASRIASASAIKIDEATQGLPKHSEMKPLQSRNMQEKANIGDLKVVWKLIFFLPLGRGDQETIRGKLEEEERSRGRIVSLYSTWRFKANSKFKSGLKFPP